MIKSVRIACLFGAFAVSTYSHSIPVLDQENLPNQGVGGQGIGQFVDFGSQVGLHQSAQTFTVGIAGLLNRIEVPVYNSRNGFAGGGTQPVTMAIRSVIAGAPNSDDSQNLGSIDIPASSLSTNFDPASLATWVAFDLGSLGIMVSVGQSLAFSLSTAEPLAYLYTPEIPGDYLEGAGFRRNRLVTETWTTPGYDYLFRTFVDVPEPGSLALLGLGLACLGAISRRRSQ